MRDGAIAYTLFVLGTLLSLPVVALSLLFWGGRFLADVG